MLGEMPSVPADVLVDRLLSDPDARVRANTIEALEARGADRQFMPTLAQRAREAPGSRERANAIKALHSMKVSTASGQLLAMLRDERPEPTVGSYWPFAPTLWDYINRAMPMPVPHTLSADDVYALTAYILSLNDLVPPEFVADRNSLPKVKMRNRDNFIWTDPRPDTMAKPCMNNCVNAADVRLSSSAEGRNLTPRTTGPLDTMQPK